MNDRSSAATPLRILFTIGAAGSMSDGDLLRRYLDGRVDEAECAFAVLVDRHGAMVRHVCLSILGNPDDAADAYQATFLILARRAGAIHKANSVGPWLFGVARRVALRARSRASRRRLAERSLAEHTITQPTPAAPEPIHPDDWAILYDELDRLPARYRDPLVLCYLQGMTHDQASSQLGIPTPTLRTRLSRARDRLRPRLVRRGLTPSSASSLLLAPVPLTSSASSLASIGWASAASRLAVASRGVSLASLSVPLATSTLRSMLMISAIQALALGGIALSVLGLGAGAAGFNPWGKPDAVSSQEAASSPEPFASALLAADQDDPAPSPELTPDEQPMPEDAPIEVRSGINRPIEILMLVPEGTAVARGQIICKFVTTDHRNNLATQRVATEHAKAEYSSAINDREIAELAVREYLDGVFAQQKLAALGEVELAEAELELAIARFDRLEGAQEIKEVLDTLEPAEARIGVIRANLAAAEARIEVLRAEQALKQAQKALEVLQTLTLEKQIKLLEDTVEKAKFEENTKLSAFELEKEREDQIRRWINETQIRAPSDGVVIHAEGVQEGATLGPMRGGRLLLEIHPPSDEPEGSSDPTNRPFEIDPTR